MVPILTKVVFHHAEAMSELDDNYALALERLLHGEDTEEDTETLISTLETQLSDDLIIFPHEIQPTIDEEGHIAFTATVMHIKCDA